nr:sugar ABC transporter substrate-binding protein [Lentibacillus saliphilus]
MLVFFTACSDEDANANQDNASNDNGAADNADGDNGSEALSGEVEFMTISLRPAFDDYLDGLKEAFEAEHPDVTVTINDVPYDQVEQIILTSASSGNLPDVMNLNKDFVKKIASMGALVNMDEAAADVKDTFFEGIWETGEIDGSVYALPWYTTTNGLIYNPDILAEAGFDAPPKTYEEAWEMSKVIYEKTGAYGEVIQPEMHILMPKNGISILNEDSTAAAFNIPETVELWTDYKSYYEDGLFPIDVLLKQTEMTELYAQEKVAWWATGPQLFRYIKDLSPEVYEKSLGGAPLEGKAGVQAANPMNIAVSAKSKSKDAAVAFAKFVTNAENQLEFAKEASVLPPVIDAANDEFFSQGEDSEDATERGRYYAAQALHDAMNMSLDVSNVTEINQAIEDAFVKVILEDLPVEDALAEAEATVNGLLQ